MDKRRVFHQHQEHSRPDRSRSPLRDLHPWEKTSFTAKSVLYSSEVQFQRRSPSKFAQQHRSPSKPSCSKAHSNCTSSNPAKVPLREQPHANRSRSGPRQLDPDAGVKRLVEKLQKWNKMYSPPKFMAGMMSAGEKHDLPVETTPKRRSQGPWYIQYFIKEDRREQQGSSKKSSFKENIIRIEKENRRTDVILTDRTEVSMCASSAHPDHKKASAQTNLSSNIVETDEDGYAIPSVGRQSGQLTPAHELEPSSFMTPSKAESPYEAFFTPLTHPRSTEIINSKSAEATKEKSHPEYTTTPQKPQFSLINVNKTPSSSFLEHDTTLKERTEVQLAEYERVSNRLDKALKEANEVLNRPIKLGLPSSTSNTNFPPFTEERQTIDPAQMEKIHNGSVAREQPSRHSLPSEGLASKKSSTPNRTFVINENEDTHGAYAVSPIREKNPAVHLPRGNISLSKALGASMAAELAYAERAQRIQTHLLAAHRLSSAVDREVDRCRDQSYKGDDIDRILDSISLRDESFLNSSIREQSSMTGPTASKKSPLKVQSKMAPSPVKLFTLNSAERKVRKEKVEQYLRMCHRLRALQHLMYHKKRRLTSNPRQLMKIDELSKAVDSEYHESVIEAKSWLSRRISQREFLLLIERREKEIYIESENCCNTIKHLRSAQLQPIGDSASTPTLTAQSPVDVAISTGSEISPVRMDTRALNESVECDVFDLSARSLRRSLEARREQAEMLNRSFEEKTRDIEQKTKQSIAAQIVQYDRVIAERTTLLHKLDEIEASPEQNPVLQQTPTPRRVGIEPLDLSQLSSKEDESIDESNEVPVEVQVLEQEHLSDVDHTDVGINRAYSHSTIYEDSLSHFDEDEDRRPSSASSEATLYQSDLDDEQREAVGKEPTNFHPSRRTLDTAEALTMLSRQIVTVVSGERVQHEPDQMLKQIVEEATRKDASGNALEKRSQNRLSWSDVADSAPTSLPVQPPIQQISTIGAFEHEGLLEGAGDFVTTPCESARVEICMSKTGESQEYVEQHILDKAAAHSSEVVGPVTLEAVRRIGREELKESGKFSSLVSLESSPIGPKSNKEESLFSQSSATSLPEGVVDPVVTVLEANDTAVLSDIDQTEVTDEATLNKELSEEFSNEDGTQSSDFDSIGDLEEGEPQEKLSTETKSAERESLSSDDLSSSTSESRKKKEHNANAAADAEHYAESGVKTHKSTTELEEFAAKNPENVEISTRMIAHVGIEDFGEVSKDVGDVSSTTIFEDLSYQADKEKDTEPVELAASISSAPEENIKSYEKRATEPYELSFLERTVDRTMEGRASLGLNRSEICDSLSTSILQCMIDSPRRRSLPRTYNLEDSLLKDSLIGTPKSPRAPKERFNTKMPMQFSPHSQKWLEDAETSIADSLVNDVLSNMRLTELDREVEEITARVERRSMTSPTEDTSEVQKVPSESFKPTKDLIQPLDETYEDLLSIEKPTSQLNRAFSFVETVPEPVNSHVADTPRKALPSQLPTSSAADIKQKRAQELNEQVHSEEWMKKKCEQFLDSIWSKKQSRGFIRPLVDEFIPPPKVVDEVVPQSDDEELLLENRTFLIWDAMNEVASKLWPESPGMKKNLGSKLLPVPRTKEEFADKAVQYVLEKLSGMPPSHCYNRLSHPPAPPYVDTSVDRAVARLFYEEDPYCFARTVHAEFRQLCEDIIERVGDRFIIPEVQRLQQSFAMGNNDGASLNASTVASGEFGRPSLARLSLASGTSVGRCSVTTASPLRIVPEMSEL